MKYIPNTTNNYKPPSNATVHFPSQHYDLIYVTRSRRLDPIHHYRLIQRLGFPDGVRCWCGAELEFAVKEDWASRDKKRRAFFDAHEECSPKEQTHGR